MTTTSATIILTAEALQDYMADYAEKVAKEAVEAALAAKMPAVKKEQQRLLTSTEVMTMLHVSRTTLWQWERIGKLVPVCIVGKNKRYNPNHVNALINTTHYDIR